MVWKTLKSLIIVLQCTPVVTHTVILSDQFYLFAIIGIIDMLSADSGQLISEVYKLNIQVDA